jgi:hypothetical protein
LQNAPDPDLEAIAMRVIHAVAREGATSASGARLLLRQYLATGRDDIRDALGIALAQALAHAAEEPTIAGRAAWLSLLVEAVAVADDDRIVAAARGLADTLSAGWPAADALRDGAPSVDACLQASAVVDPREIVPAAIDELERIVAASYRPGAGLTDPASARSGSCADHVRTASALLTAFELTGRLPYSMLAEELMQGTLRRLTPDDELATQCDTARVLCRLAALHDAAEYRSAAVIASGADYRADAARLLRAQAPRVGAASTADAALYAVAMRELTSLR